MLVPCHRRADQLEPSGDARRPFVVGDGSSTSTRAAQPRCRRRLRERNGRAVPSVHADGRTAARDGGWRSVVLLLGTVECHFTVAKTTVTLLGWGAWRRRPVVCRRPTL